MIPYLGTLIEKGWVSPAFGRFLEAALSVAAAAFVMYLADKWSEGAANAADIQAAGTVAIAAALQFAAKSYRDAQKADAEAPVKD